MVGAMIESVGAIKSFTINLGTGSAKTLAVGSVNPL